MIHTEVELTVSITISAPESLVCPYCAGDIECWKNKRGAVSSMSHGLRGCEQWDRLEEDGISLDEVRRLSLERSFAVAIDPPPCEGCVGCEVDGDVAVVEG